MINKKNIVATGLLVLWVGDLSIRSSVHSSDINGLNRSIVDIKMQYAEYDAKLTELIIKQDRRITLLEDLVESRNANNKN